MLKKEIKLTSEEITLIIDEDTELTINYVGLPKTEIKSRIKLVHLSQGITSRINVRAIVFDNAKFDFEGVLIIEKGAKNTDTYLKIDCLTVGENAFARAIPSLEIKESEVKGGHGATIGYIDENQLNYLYSRGLDKKVAEGLLIKAFIAKS